MPRHTLPVLASLVGFVLAGAVTGQGAASSSEKKVELVKYPMPGSEDAVGVVASPADRAVLDDFYRSKPLANLDKAADTNDAAMFAHLMADGEINSDERFGRGVILSKDVFVNNFRSGGHHFRKMQHDRVRLVPFGPNMVVESAHSTSFLHYGGRVSPGPRLLTEVWVKMDGRWQVVVHAMSDLEGGMESRSKQ